MRKRISHAHLSLTGRFSQTNMGTEGVAVSLLSLQVRSIHSAISSRWTTNL